MCSLYTLPVALGLRSVTPPWDRLLSAPSPCFGVLTRGCSLVSVLIGLGPTDAAYVCIHMGTRLTASAFKLPRLAAAGYSRVDTLGWVSHCEKQFVQLVDERLC